MMRKERDVSHLISVGSRPDVGQRHFPVGSRLTFAHEEIDFVGFGWIVGMLPCGDHREAAIDALRALAAMRMQHRHVMDARATPRVSDQIAAPVSRYPFDHLRFSQPHKWVTNIEGTTKDTSKQEPKSRQNLRMRGSASASANNLGNQWQIEADDPVFKDAELISAQELRRHRSEGREQKRPSPVRELLAEIAIQSRPYGDVEHAVGAEPASKLIDQARLRAGDLGTRPVAHKCNLLTMHGEPINGSRE
jgi:hypothetical protein